LLRTTERRVTKMAVENMSKQEIAQALFVTTKTVEVHLGSASHKLGIGSLSELGEALGTPA
jgi:DNA-binding CsgD family transcriptional regulator